MNDMLDLFKTKLLQFLLYCHCHSTVCTISRGLVIFPASCHSTSPASPSLTSSFSLTSCSLPLAPPLRHVCLLCLRCLCLRPTLSNKTQRRREPLPRPKRVQQPALFREPPQVLPLVAKKHLQSGLKALFTTLAQP